LPRHRPLLGNRIPLEDHRCWKSGPSDSKNSKIGKKPCGGIFDLDEWRKELTRLDGEVGREDFWQDGSRAQGILQKRSQLDERIKSFEKISHALSEARVYLDLCTEGEAVEEDLGKTLDEAAQWLDGFEMDMMLDGQQDGANAFLTIHPGAGGTESQDWAAMLLRMYLRWGERHGFRLEMVDELPGEEAGIKSVTVRIVGPNAYGYLKAENGVHRLVRISPFDANSRRHTSFASVYAYPEIEDDIEIKIEEKDLRVDTYRSSGAGGQHVNVTDSAVRITHIPTGIVVQCQNERSQHRNKEMALKVLRARMYERALQEREEERDREEGKKKEIAWGSQIRSYVLHPYRLIKDHRTRMEIGDVDRVLDGDLDRLIREFLMGRHRLPT
jgi:peptide chain release factor 2